MGYHHVQKVNEGTIWAMFKSKLSNYLPPQSKSVHPSCSKFFLPGGVCKVRHVSNVQNAWQILIPRPSQWNSCFTWNQAHPQLKFPVSYLVINLSNIPCRWAHFSELHPFFFKWIHIYIYQHIYIILYLGTFLYIHTYLYAYTFKHIYIYIYSPPLEPTKRMFLPIFKLKNNGFTIHFPMPHPWPLWETLFASLSPRNKIFIIIMNSRYCTTFCATYDDTQCMFLTDKKEMHTHFWCSSNRQTERFSNSYWKLIYSLQNLKQ